VGFIQEATGDLRKALFYTAFGSLALVVSAVLLRNPGRTATPA
jgi:phage tail protein X